MNAGLKTIIFPVTDSAKAKELYTRLLGVEPYADTPYYVGFRLGDQEIGLDPNRRGPGPHDYWHVDDIKATLQSLLAAGGEIGQDITDVGGGKLIASVTDADGNVLGILQEP
jgi:predicted enzyme related to lactoylglutathione lyase